MVQIHIPITSLITWADINLLTWALFLFYWSSGCIISLWGHDKQSSHFPNKEQILLHMLTCFYLYWHFTTNSVSNTVHMHTVRQKFIWENCQKLMRPSFSRYSKINFKCECCSIWDYLVQLTGNHQTTVIITTHYIEEAKQADVVSEKLYSNATLWSFL